MRTSRSNVFGASETGSPSEEVAAVAAHEIGHEYVWDTFEQAKSRKDNGALRQLELACDAIAAKILLRDGITPERLARALETMEMYNLEHFGIASDQDCHPGLRQRRRMLLRMTTAGACGTIKGCRRQ